MTTIAKEITYKELQAWAKDNGIKANQAREELERLHAEAHAPTVEANPFEAYMPQQQTSAPRGNAFPPSAKVLAYLTDLRTRHNRSLEGLSTISYTEAQKEIDELRLLPAPASAKQLEIIRKTIAEMNEQGAKVNISEQKIASLTGGREGTASKLIDFLFTQRQRLSIEAPPSDNQIDRLVEWFACPDIPFENYGVEKKIPMPHVSEKAWRHMLPDEFKEELRTKMTRAQASQLIDAHRTDFYNWKSSRITQNQMKYIRQLDERLARVVSTQEVNYAIDNEGNIIEVGKSNANTYAPRAHEPLSDFQLMMLSVTEAEKYIDQMRSELKETYPSIDNSSSQQDLNDKVQSFSDRTGTGSAKTQNDARIREFSTLNDLIYKLEARIGFENAELHDMVKEVLIDGAGDSIACKNAIREFMHLAVDMTSKERAFKSAGALLQLTEDTEIGTKIAMEVNTSVQAEFSNM